MHCVYRCFDPYANSLIVDFDSVGRGVIAASVLALIKLTLAPESIMNLTGVLLIETVTFGCVSFFSASMVKVYPTVEFVFRAEIVVFSDVAREIVV